MNRIAYENINPVWSDVRVNSQALSFFRILFALLLLFDLFVYVLPYWDFLYSSQGAFMASERVTDISWSIMRYSDNPFYQFSIVGVYILALLGFLVGYRTRLCAFIAFLTLKVLLDRNPAANSNAEALETFFLLWCAFMPMDRYWSVAAASRGSEPRKSRWPVIPVMALKAQILIVYFCSGMFKLEAEPWWNGSAISFALSDGYYGSAIGSSITELMPASMLFLACWGIIIMQLVFSALVYAPLKGYFTRIIALVAAAMMHIGFIFLMQLYLFPYLCLTYLILLFPDEWITSLLKKRRGKLEKIQIYYDSDCGFCRRVAFLMKEFCLSPFTPVLPADSNPDAHSLLEKHYSWVVYGFDGEVYLKWRAASYVLKQSPVFFIFGYLTDIPLIRPLMEKLYTGIGNNRVALGRLSAPFLTEQPDRYLERTQQFICFFLFAIALSFTIWSLPQIKAPVPNDLYTVAQQAGVLQVWDLFAPKPVAYSYTFEVNASDKFGKPISLEPFTKKHFEVEGSYFNFSSPRLLKYYAAMFRRDSPRHREGYARYMCWQTYNVGTPANKIQLHLKIQHNFEKYDTNNITTNYSCDRLMR